MPKTICLDSNVLIQNLGEEAVLLHLDKEEYFGLDPIGMSMLSALQETGSVQAACEQLLRKYDVAPEELEADLVELIGKLEQHGIVKVTETSAS